MGREAICSCRWGEGSGEVKALLEAAELILRGAVRRKIAVAQMKDVRVVGDALLFEAEAETIGLDLGAGTAASWARKIATPPPTLQHKLGLKDGAKALVIGRVDDAALVAALEGQTTRGAQAARMCVAVVANEAELAQAIQAHAALTGPLPIWIAHRKGPASPFGETAVRRAMRARGYVDSKSASVSEQLSATRYAKR